MERCCAEHAYAEHIGSRLSRYGSKMSIIGIFNLAVPVLSATTIGPGSVPLEEAILIRSQ